MINVLGVGKERGKRRGWSFSYFFSSYKARERFMHIFLEMEASSTYHIIPLSLMFHSRVFYLRNPLHSITLQQVSDTGWMGLQSRTWLRMYWTSEYLALPLLFPPFRPTQFRWYTDIHPCWVWVGGVSFCSRGLQCSRAVCDYMAVSL